jgi:hypothetical protein
VLDDPSEYADHADARPDIVAELRSLVAEYQAGVFSPQRGTDDGAACAAAMGRHGQFWGPFVP